MWPLVTGFFHLAHSFPGPSMFCHGLVPPSLFWPNNILLCGYTTFWLPIHEVMDMPCIILEIVSIFFKIHQKQGQDDSWFNVTISDYLRLFRL